MPLDASMREVNNGFIVQLTEEMEDQDYSHSVDYVFLDREDAVNFIVNYFKGK